MRPDQMATRREFLNRGLTLVGSAATIPVFLGHSARALAAQASTRKSTGEPVLVVLQLAGGNDGLNTIVPLGNERYEKHRPQLAVRKSAALALTDDYGLHPSLTGLKSLYDDGLLAVVQGVGYPNPNRSHFKSMDIWQTASPDGRQHTGWLGRYFDNCCGGEPKPERGIALTSETPLAMRGRRFQPVAFQRPESLTWGAERRGRGRDEPAMRAFEALNAPPRRRPPAGELAYLQRASMDARLSARQIQDAARGRGGSYPGSPLAGSLRTVARMISSDMPTRIYYVSQGGYDTHAGQAGRHAQLLTQLGDALKAFVADLKASGQFDRVTIMTFSEFGRRVAENASGGTDHGTAAPMFVIGKRVRPGLHGTFPSLETLDAGDLIFTTDFRSVYASVLRDGLGTPPGAVVGAEFAPLALFNKS